MAGNRIKNGHLAEKAKRHIVLTCGYHKLALILFLVFWVNLGQAQPTRIDDSKPQVLSLSGHYGFIIPHREELREVAGSYPWSIQAEWSRRHNTQAAWDYCACYPKIGIALNYTHFGNPEVLGSSYAAMSFIEPYLSFSGKLKPSFRLGAGFTYLNQVYNANTNPENLFFSFPVSFFLQAHLGLNYEIARQWHLISGVAYSHISNGGVKQPNRGINFPTLNIGLEYSLQPVELHRREKVKSIREIHPEKRFWLVQPFFSRRDIANNLGRSTLVGMSASYHRIVGRLSALHGGLEGVRDSSPQRYDDTANTYSFGLVAGHDFLLGKLIFSQQLGYYFIKPTARVHDFYQRVGVQYLFAKNLQAGISLKTHTSVADFVDIRVGFRW